MDEERQRSQGAVERSILDLVFLGFKSQVLALDRYSGEVVWTWKAPKGRSPHVALLLDGDRLMVSVQGYTYCLNPIDGLVVWENPLSGYGVGIPSLASIYGSSGSTAAAAIIAQQQQAAAAGGASTGT